MDYENRTRHRRDGGLRISLDLDRLALGGMPSRTRHPAVLVIQLAHSREITLGDNTLAVASACFLPRQYPLDEVVC